MVEDVGQKPVDSCRRLLLDFTRSGVCERDGRRYVVGARGDAVRVGDTQLAVASVSTLEVVKGDEEILDKRPKARFLVVELRVSAPGRAPVWLRELELFGNLLRAGPDAVRPSGKTSLAGDRHAPATNDQSVPPGRTKTIAMVYDLDRRVLRRVRRVEIPSTRPQGVPMPPDNRERPVIQFVASRTIRYQLLRNQVAESGQIGVLRLVPPVARRAG